MLDILTTLSGLTGRYSSAIFLTYTLDLNFFEELVAPKLDALGCTNVTILADQHGYNEALNRGGNHLRRPGRQYVCAPVISPGRGVQHAKAILLVGPEKGFLLVGSGNLTLHGIGRNLEQFIRFDFSADDENSTTLRYPFATVWQLIQDITSHTPVSSTVVERLHMVAEQAPWLNEAVQLPPNLRLWHSFHSSIMGQWQVQGTTPVQNLYLVSPFWSPEAVAEIAKQFQPAQINLCLNPADPKLDGLFVQQKAETWGCEVEFFAVENREERPRPLHAKTFVGLADDSAWCLCGSANCTWAGLLQSWVAQGNLELVVWQEVDDPQAFNEVWQSEGVALRPLPPATIQGTPGEETTGNEIAMPLRLNELCYMQQRLTGQVIWIGSQEVAPFTAGTWELELRRARQRFAFKPDNTGRFELHLTEPLDRSESGRITWHPQADDTYTSPFLWIDQPLELARFGNRTYNAQVQASLQTFAGAGELFESLLNFLWERVDPQQIQETGESRRRQGSRGRPRDDDANDAAAPPASAFVTDEELSTAILWHVEGYAPHNRSIHSLRDLLSLALLRLTVETKPQEQDQAEAEDREDSAAVENERQQTEERHKVLQRLREYVIRYCRRYASSLTNPDFVARIGPELLLENHYTLGRVLLEFHEKVSLFSDSDLRYCILLLYGALFWPTASEQRGPGTWQLFLDSGYDIEQLRSYWQKLHMPVLTTVLITQAWGKPLSWEKTQHDMMLVQRFMLSRKLVEHISQQTGAKFWLTPTSPTLDARDVVGFRHVYDLTSDDLNLPLGNMQKEAEAIAKYRTPAEEKYFYLLNWWQLFRQGKANTPEAQLLLKENNHLGYEVELRYISQLGQTGNIKVLNGAEEHCPSCFIRLPASLTQKLHLYQLHPCPHCRQTILYWKPALDLMMF